MIFLGSEGRSSEVTLTDAELSERLVGLGTGKIWLWDGPGVGSGTAVDLSVGTMLWNGPSGDG